ncbi:hypothetical protein [Rhizobium phage RHph_X2_26]|nr:hypothetical protein [Rhizobium phage RHph_X2_26]
MATPWMSLGAFMDPPKPPPGYTTEVRDSPHLGFVTDYRFVKEQDMGIQGVMKDVANDVKGEMEVARAAVQISRDRAAAVKRPIDAILHDVVISERGGQRYAWGRMEADTKNRWPDGTWVHTSRITAQYRNVLYTGNSVYFVASYAPRETAKGEPKASAMGHDEVARVARVAAQVLRSYGHKLGGPTIDSMAFEVAKIVIDGKPVPETPQDKEPAAGLKVRCVNSEDAHFLSAGAIYDVEREWADVYSLRINGQSQPIAFRKDRFEIVEPGRKVSDYDWPAEPVEDNGAVDVYGFAPPVPLPAKTDALIAQLCLIEQACKDAINEATRL